MQIVPVRFRSRVHSSILFFIRMPADFFFAGDLSGETIAFSESESHHCIRVLRHRQGDLVNVVDGNGTLITGKILEENSTRVLVSTESSQKDYGKRNFYLHLAISQLSDNDRFEFFLEKAVEIGIEEITPLICRRTQVKFYKEERWKKILLSAMKQSGRAILPKLNSPVKISEFFQRKTAGLKCMAHCQPGDKKSLRDILPAQNSLTCLIGPEGDFSDEEIDLAMTGDFVPITLGDFRLRAETAGVAVVNAVSLIV